MNRNFHFSDTNHALPHLCRMLLTEGTQVPSRLGETTTELLHVGVSLMTPLNREILLPTRRASLVAQIAESAWVLSGRNDIQWLERYLPRAKDFSDDGKVWRGAYGPRLRGGGMHGPDQLVHVYRLLKEDPNSRRAVVNIYDSRHDTKPGKDIPCNDFLNFTLRDGVLDLAVYIRSNDLIWGWSGINVFEWSVVLEVMASWLDARVGALHFSIGSLHIYDRHLDRAARISEDESVAEQALPSPRFVGSGPVQLGDELAQFFHLEAGARAGDPLGQEIEDMANPLLQSWMRIIAHHWSGDEEYLVPLAGTRLLRAYAMSPGKEDLVPDDLLAPRMSDAASVGGGLPGSWSLADIPTPGIPAVEKGGFVDRVSQLHAVKHESYGDSWKRRGELFSILPNVARKVDRLGTGRETPDESQVDTAVDLLVYLAKYRWWLADEGIAPRPCPSRSTDEVERVSDLLSTLPKGAQILNEEVLLQELDRIFDLLLQLAEAKDPRRWREVDTLLDMANLVARSRDWKHANATRAWQPSEPVERVGTHGWPYRPSQPAVGSAGSLCGSPSPDGRYRCNRKPHRDGDHVAEGHYWDAS